MTKEMKRPASHISGNSIKPALSKAVEFYTDNNRQAHECIRERDEYIDYLESKLNNARPQQALPVVPECVGEWIECVKGKNKNALALLDDDNMPDDVNEWLFFQRHDKNINLILRAWLDGYTVEKPQLFYLKSKSLLENEGESEEPDVDELYLNAKGNLVIYKGDAKKFTQSEIDSMQTGSYEKIEVAE